VNFDDSPPGYFELVDALFRAIVKWHVEHPGKICKIWRPKPSVSLVAGLDDATNIIGRNDNARDMIRFVDEETKFQASTIQFLMAWDKYKN
jgi:hypothetical protein